MYSGFNIFTVRYIVCCTDDFVNKLVNTHGVHYIPYGYECIVYFLSFYLQILSRTAVCVIVSYLIATVHVDTLTSEFWVPFLTWVYDKLFSAGCDAHMKLFCSLLFMFNNILKIELSGTRTRIKHKLAFFKNKQAKPISFPPQQGTNHLNSAKYSCCYSWWSSQ